MAKNKEDQFTIIIDLLEDIARGQADLEERVSEAIEKCMGRLTSYSTDHSNDD